MWDMKLFSLPCISILASSSIVSAILCLLSPSSLTVPSKSQNSITLATLSKNLSQAKKTPPLNSLNPSKRPPLLLLLPPVNHTNLPPVNNLKCPKTIKNHLSEKISYHPPTYISPDPILNFHFVFLQIYSFFIA